MVEILPGKNVECLYTAWKKWGRYSSKKQHHVCYWTLSATIYPVWCAENYSLWNNVVLLLDKLVESIKEDVLGRV